MTLYIYDTSSREVVAEIVGSDNTSCEAVAAERFGDTDYIAGTYTPAFGASDGLTEIAEPERIEA